MPANFRLSYQAIGGVIATMEAVGIIFASVLAQILYQNYWLAQRGTDVILGVSLFSALVYVPMARSADLYRLPQILHPQRHFGKISTIWITGVFFLTAILFLLKVGSDLSRGVFFTFCLLELPLLLATRVAAAAIINSLMDHGRIAGRTAVVIGEVTELKLLGKSDLLRRFGLSEINRIVLRLGSRDRENIHACRSSLNDAIAFAREAGAEEFAIAIGWSQSDALDQIKDALRNSPLPVRLLPDLVVRSAFDGRLRDSSLHPMISVEIQRAPMTFMERCAKRTVDVILASLALLILLPICLAVALLIKLESPGPVIFRQHRNGFNQRQFAIYKFRSMRVLENGGEIRQATRHDPRVTRVGRLLRRTSIDELPQLLNVLKGDMSLVGPRPHALAHDDQYKELIATYCYRHHVKPGITGWAQVNGLRGETRNLTRMERRIDFDLWYINNWSIGLDIQILFRTCFAVLKQDAY